VNLRVKQHVTHSPPQAKKGIVADLLGAGGRLYPLREARAGSSGRSLLAFRFFEAKEVDAPASVAGDGPLIVVEGAA
jgi:hypothetical protein